MKNSNTNARDVVSNSIDHKFPWKWNLKDLENVKKNGKTVFSCFSCGGGSTMGYKLAGYTVIGNCEIDRNMEEIYLTNHHPKYSYLMDIRDFNKLKEYPEELKSLDILDGSPPCSVFSTIGKREKGWGVEKQFREGQEKQRLDDLFFHFLHTAEKLLPKVIVAENVTGLLKGNAKGYMNEILKEFHKIGYEVQIFQLNSATMGVPQKRERVFFIARKKLSYPKIELSFKEKAINFGAVRSDNGRVVFGKDADFLQKRRKTDKYVSWIEERETGRKIGNFRHIVNDNDICPTSASSGNTYRGFDGMAFSERDYVNVQTFPQDYDFGKENVQYVCGMSVPPVMMANIASEIYNQWLKYDIPDGCANSGQL